MDMKWFHKKNAIDLFSLTSNIIAVLVMLFIGSAIMAIIFGGIGQIKAALLSPEIGFAFGMSFGTATLSTFLVILFALPTAYAYTKTDMPFRNITSVLLEMTISMPFILLGLSLLILFSTPFGKAVKEAGFRVIFSPTGIVMAQMLVNLPYAIRLIITAFLSVSRRMEFVAQTLGASRFQSFRTVLMPMCRKSIVSTCILTWSRAFGEFGATLMLVGITRFKTETLPGSIYLCISTGDNSMAMATATIMLAVSAATLYAANKLGDSKNSERIDEKIR